VKFELLLELKIEQKTVTSLVKLVLSRRKSGLRTERLSVPVIYFRYCTGSTRTSPVIRPSQLLYHDNDDTVATIQPVLYQGDDDISVEILDSISSKEDKNNFTKIRERMGRINSECVPILVEMRQHAPLLEMRRPL
jgi:hypothetical protein